MQIEILLGESIESNACLPMPKEVNEMMAKLRGMLVTEKD